MVTSLMCFICVISVSNEVESKKALIAGHTDHFRLQGILFCIVALSPSFPSFSFSSFPSTM